jgi:hypothetical protein
VPNVLRWEFKLEPNQALQVLVFFVGDWSSRQRFYACMSKDGRIRVPKTTSELLKADYDGDTAEAGAIVEVKLAPPEMQVTDEEE